ncbi:hypothetical protein [Mycobacterium kubicae]|uniref:hypothetical protein n=1 Tax=Mycobacterium kubicae TaxID=120959 RepID=UPI00104214DA|nr:hypothetical protein [Mycobacterium kubicae]
MTGAALAPGPPADAPPTLAAAGGDCGGVPGTPDPADGENPPATAAGGLAAVGGTIAIGAGPGDGPAAPSGGAGGEAAAGGAGAALAALCAI